MRDYGSNALSENPSVTPAYFEAHENKGWDTNDLAQNLLFSAKYMDSYPLMFPERHPDFTFETEEMVAGEINQNSWGIGKSQSLKSSNNGSHT